MSTDPATAPEHSPASDSVDVVQNETSRSASADLIFRNGTPAPEAFRGRLPAPTLGLLGPTESIPGIMTDSLVPPTPLARSLRGSPPADGPAAGGTDNQEPIQAAPEGDAPPPPVQEGGNGDAPAAPESGAPPPVQENGNADTPVAPVPRAVVDLRKLREAGRNVTAVKRLIYFSNHREEDPLRNGPWGINKFSLATSASSVDKDNIPRFVPVVFGFHSEVPDADLQQFMDDWDSEVYKDIHEAAGDDPALLEMVHKAVDKEVRGMARETFLRIHTTQMLNQYSGGNSAAADVRRMLTSFLEGVKITVNLTIQQSIMHRTIQWTAVNRERD
jgi:hypothetical protein